MYVITPKTIKERAIIYGLFKNPEDAQLYLEHMGLPDYTVVTYQNIPTRTLRRILGELP